MPKNLTFTSHAMGWPKAKGETEKKLFTTHNEAYEALGLDPKTGELKNGSARDLTEFKRLGRKLGFELEDGAGNPKAATVQEPEADPEDSLFADDGGDK